MDRRTLDRIATVMDACLGERRSGQGRGHPPADTVRVLATLRQFLREGTPWRGLKATPEKASGSTLRRRLQDWGQRRACCSRPMRCSWRCCAATPT
jgi:hypothetical protein